MAPIGRLRVLAVSPFPDLYGAGRMLARVCEAMVRRGWDVLLLAPEGGEMLEGARGVGMPVEVLPFRVLRKGELGGLARDLRRDLRTFDRLLREFRPDVVYANTLTLPTALVAARRAGVPSVCHVREAEDGLGGLKQHLMHLPLALASSLVFNSAHSRMAALPFLRGPVRRHAEVVYNRIPLPERRPLPPMGDGLRLLMMGRLSPRKGQDVFLHALALARGTGAQVDAVIAGTPFRGYEWYEEQLREQVRSTGLDGHVEFRGFVDTWDAIADVHVVVVPSRVEPFGNVAVEGGLLGRPVIASRVGGLSEIVRNLETGFLVTPEAPEELARAIRLLASDEGLMSSMGAAALAHCQERFGAPACGDGCDPRLLDLLASAARS